MSAETVEKALEHMLEILSRTRLEKCDCSPESRPHGYLVQGEGEAKRKSASFPMMSMAMISALLVDVPSDNPDLMRIKAEARAIGLPEVLQSEEVDAEIVEMEIEREAIMHVMSHLGGIGVLIG